MPYTGKTVEFKNKKGEVAGRVGPTYLHPQEAAQAIRDANFPGPHVTTLAVMREESLLSPDAEGDLLMAGEPTADGRKWGPSIGLMQIRSIQGVDFPEWLRDPRYNLIRAAELYRERGFRPWGAYTSKRYQKHLAWAAEVFQEIDRSTSGGTPKEVEHMGWRLVGSLKRLLAEVNSIAPQRSKASDGTIGDTAHSARRSDHNPEGDGTVDALDITHDPAHGCDVDKIFARIIANKDPRVKYLIRNDRIMGGRLGPSPWVWREYNGSNPHTKHGHISVLDEGQDDPSPWLGQQEDILAAISEERFAALEQEVADIKTALFDKNDDAAKAAGGRGMSVMDVLVEIRNRLPKKEAAPAEPQPTPEA